MSENDPVSAMLSNVLSCETRGRTECLIKPISTVIKKVLVVMKEEGYIGNFREIEDGRGNMLKVDLLGVINKCGSIKPRYSVKKLSYEKFEKRYLPAKDIGILVVSTSQGIMPHIQAKKKGLGGKLLMYCY